MTERIDSIVSADVAENDDDEEEEVGVSEDVNVGEEDETLSSGVGDRDRAGSRI